MLIEDWILFILESMLNEICELSSIISVIYDEIEIMRKGVLKFTHTHTKNELI